MLHRTQVFSWRRDQPVKNPGRTGRNGGAAMPSASSRYAGHSDDELLDLRLCDLRVSLRHSTMAPRIARLYAELQARGLHFRPHFWLSDEWFTPDGVPGVAIPFYLADPRLTRLERRQMLEAEGAGDAECMRLLRHEAGHAIDNAYRLRRRRRWREHFGPAGLPYPKYYEPEPGSRHFVQHLDNWYAQSHPAEDFAETFAVWLQPKSGWRRHYAGWPVMEKLEYVNELMKEIAGSRPPVTRREHINPLRDIRRSLRQHYRARRSHYGLEHPDIMDDDLRRLFVEHAEHPRGRSAGTFIQSVRRRVRAAVARWSGQPQYTVDQILGDMIKRCRELRLKTARAEAVLERELIAMVTAELIHFMHEGRMRVPL